MNYTKHLKTLELDKILAMLADYAICEETKKNALEIQPCDNYEDALHLLKITADAHMLTTRYGTPSVYRLNPCADTLKRAEAGGILGFKQLLDTAKILSCTRSLIAWKSSSKDEITTLDSMFELLEPVRTLEEDITGKILSEEEISDKASPELYEIRRKIRLSQSKAREYLDRMTKSASTSKYLQEQIVTIRNGRFVVPVKSENRGEVPGIIHDTSASGATLFVEPNNVVELNNQVRELESREKHEIDRILYALSAQVGDNASTIRSNYDIILMLDLYFAKTRLADKMAASVPVLNNNGVTELNKARHPLIAAEDAVPIDIRLGGDFDTLIITGPNTGGKTVALKTMGLLTVMAMCGFMIPCAENSRISFYNKVLADIGDEQSIEQSLSTFSSHMKNIISILREADSKSLVLMDELGAGTDPTEGAALAISVITHLRGLRSKVIATTHYAEIKVFALETAGIENASCEFDIKTLKPTFKLLIGIPGRSNAFAISEKLGLPPQIIGHAKTLISSENTKFEDVVSGLEETRWQLEKEKQLAEKYKLETRNAKEEAEKLIEKLTREKDLEIENARSKARSIIEQVRFKSDLILNELEGLKKQKDKADFSRQVSSAGSSVKKYIRELEDEANPVQSTSKRSKYVLPRALKFGDRVRLLDFGTQGTVVSEKDNNGCYEVKAGILKTKVHFSALELLSEEKVDVSGAVSAKNIIKSAKDTAKPELDLRGRDSIDAISELTQYLDSMMLSSIKTLTIIHGKGTGALREAVRKKLKTHRGVKSFRAGAYGEGDAGVTVVELK